MVVTVFEYIGSVLNFKSFKWNAGQKDTNNDYSRNEEIIILISLWQTNKNKLKHIQN